MKRVLLLGLILGSLSAFAIKINDDWSYEINPYVSYASSFIYNSGSLCDKNPVFQMGTDNYLNYKNFSFYHGVFMNYGYDTLKDVYKRDGLNDLEFYIGVFYALDKWNFGLVYEYWYFPNLIGHYGSSEQVIHPSIVYTFDPIIIDNHNLGKISLGFDPYFYLNHDPYNYLIDWRPYINHKVTLFNLWDSDVTFNSRIGTVLRTKTTDAKNGWSSIYTKFTLGYKGIGLYYYHWFQCDKEVYSNWSYDQCHWTIGISYSYSF